MSLNFDTSKLDREFTTRKGDPERMGEDPNAEYWSHEVEAIVWAHMAVGLPGVTEDNIAKWYRRYLIWNMVIGSKEPYITVEMLRKAVGLTCNVSTETDAAWRKRMFSIMEREAEAKYNRLARELDEPKEDFGTL
jgi:hypothetical protein